MEALSFETWRYRYVHAKGGLDFESVGAGHKIGRDHSIMFAGTTAAIEKAKESIIASLRQRNKFRTGERYFDMEPFEALRDIIRSNEFDDVGGPPQLVKVYRSGNSQPFAVRWPMPHDRTLTVLGRPLFPREQTRLPVIDPDNIVFLPAKTLAKRERRAAKAG